MSVDCIYSQGPSPHQMPLFMSMDVVYNQYPQRLDVGVYFILFYNLFFLHEFGPSWKNSGPNPGTFHFLVRVTLKKMPDEPSQAKNSSRATARAINTFYRM